MKPVLTKRDMVVRYQTGEFGNRAPTWDTPEELAKSGYHDLVHLRNRVAGGETFYNLQPFMALDSWKLKANPRNWYCSAMAPHEYNLVQGEVQRGPGGLLLYYSTARFVPMREALRTARQVVGLSVKLILDAYLNDLSRQWLDYLLETYEDHVIEFSAFSVCWGTVPGHNTVIWEVRKY